MINIKDKKDCCGCNACGDICNRDAIVFNTDIEGFWYPEVNKSKCDDCGLCEKVCPVINIKDLRKNNLEQPSCYAAEHKNIEVVFDSSSGGAFSALADIMYKDKGYVGGAIFNEDFSVKHYLSNNKKDLPKLRSSKYAESDLSGFYKEVKNLLETGEKALVCGCPCQMAALRSFLGKDYDNLIIADFACRGVGSPKVFRKYLDTFEERYGSPVVYSKSQSKEFGWHNLTHKVKLANGKSHYELNYENYFLEGYLKRNVVCRPSCYDCQFKGFPRIADISLADFWEIENFDEKMDKNLGTSLIMINSQKGSDFFEKVKSRINYINIPFDSAIEGNPVLTKSLNPSLVDRKSFFEDLDRMTFSEVSQKYFSMTKKQIFRKQIRDFLRAIQAIMKFTRFNIKSIYQLLKYNKLKKILQRKFLLPTPYCVININKSTNIKINGLFRLGMKGIKNSKLETRLFVEQGGTLEVENDLLIMCGADIEVSKDAILKFKGRGGANINCTITCAERIEIGKNVHIGRNVTIRDNNGRHYVNQQGYKNSRPVIIEDVAWLCDGCTIMPGVKIGYGAIIGANSFVIGNVPPYAMVSGNPARVVDEGVLWKH